MNKKSMALLVAGVMLAGCATVKVPQPVGGSRADGIVDLAYEVFAFEKPQIDWSAAAQTAQRRCVAWGYSNAEAFGGQKTQCQATNDYGCIQTLVTITYQCTGK